MKIEIKSVNKIDKIYLTANRISLLRGLGSVAGQHVDFALRRDVARVINGECRLAIYKKFPGRKAQEYISSPFQAYLKKSRKSLVLGCCRFRGESLTAILRWARGKKS